MRVTRRDVCLGAVAGLLSGQPGWSSGQDILLRPAPVEVQWPGSDRALTGLLGFNGSVPGPEIRVKQGDDLRVRLENGLQDGALVHWHGIRVPNRMDGVSILTQDVIPPGGQFHYRFSPPDAGTFWYHAHYLSFEQVGRGLFGPLIVEETDPPDLDHDITVMIADFRLTPDGTFDTEFSVMADFAGAGRLGNSIRAFTSRDTVRAGARVRLRLINAAVDRVFPLEVLGVAGAIVALDGMPLDQPMPLGPIEIAPGQRADVIADVRSDVSFGLTDGGGRRTIGGIAATGAPKASRRHPVAALPRHDLPHPRLPARRVDLLMRGGVGDADHGGFGTWAFNGISGLPPQPIARFRRGDTGVIRLRNPTGFGHAIHLHGHHFREVLGDMSLGPLRDTLLVAPGEQREIACVFDNPGRWLLHCHMLSHSADGMATWVEVV